MDFKFSKDSGDSGQQETFGEKKKQSSLLLLLLILVGGFTYIYFFTGLIKPQEAQKTTEVTVTAAQVVKIPLPVHDGEAAAPTANTPVKDDAIAAKPAVPTTAVAAKPAAVVANPVPAVVKPVTATVKLPAAPTAKTAPIPSVKAADKKKPASIAQAKTVTVVKSKKETAEQWSIVVGNYVLEEALSADMGRVSKAGFKPVIKPAAHRKMTMNRLFLSDFADKGSAKSILEKLKQFTSDAFIIEHGGKFAIYAGSYLELDAANFEKDRLKATGFTVTVKRADIAIPSRSLSVGPFKSKEEAKTALAKLRKTGLKVTLSQK